ncbi:Amino acid transporter [Handroanthus impetiginosus]|uniref:Amino acid transporter n=1 Tax=Handroanthus impetiginosus TaxID=429701 RepID=A0A2G9HY42_9LAMI|nr:Amino acid transporter [Handroanthus impetiginosus]
MGAGTGANGGEGGSSGVTRRRACTCTKDDFLPEESFKSWGNYVNALKETPTRLVDRVFSRSSVEGELEVKARSEHEMKKTLTWWDLIWFGMGAVIGAGIFVLTGLEAREQAGPAVVLSYAVSGVSALLSVFCYTEFAVEIPVAGGSFAYLRVELGDFMAFIAAGNILLEYIIGGAAVARSWTSYFATLCNHKPQDFRIHAHSLPDDYNQLDPIAVGVIIAICILAVLSTKGSSRLNYVASVVHLIVIVFIIICGLVNAIFSRSSVEGELEVKARSEHEMKKTLTWWDLIWFGMGAVIGAGIFVLTGLEAREQAGPAVVLSYAVSGVSALLSVFCYTEFAVEIPVAGGSFAYLRVELGDFMAFIAAGNILLEYIIGGAAVARSWTSYFATLCNHKPQDFRIHAHSLPDDYNQLDPIAVGVIIAICILAVLSTKGSSRLNYVASVVHLIVIVFIIICGLVNADIKNYTPFAPYGPRGIFKASAVLFFAYVGFDAVATMAEETKNPGRDIPIGLVGSMVLTTVLYCLLAITLCLMTPYQSIDVDAPFSRAFAMVGWKWAEYVVAAGALKGMTSVLLVGAVGQARYLTHIARTHMMPPWFAKVDPKTGTPVNATAAMLAATALIAFFTKLSILSDLLSISTLFIFMLVALALIVRRYYVSGETTKENRNKLVIFIILILVSSAATSGYWALGGDGWIGYCITVPLWFLSTAGLAFLVPQARSPQVWGVPLVPWLPSASIAINAFLLGSIDKDSFIRFGIWTGILLVYYIIFGLHASYDTAKASEVKAIKDGAYRKVEEGLQDNSTAKSGSDRIDG